MLEIFLVVLISFAFAPSNGDMPSNCPEAVDHYGTNGSLPIKVSNYRSFFVECEYPPKWLPTKKNHSMDPWNIIQRREHRFESFNRSWHAYEFGFGDLKKDFFLGLEFIHALTSASENELWVHLEDWDRNIRWALYDNFVIGDKDQGYAITSLGKYSGTAGDSLRYHVGSKFTTFDKDNDDSPLENCAKLYSSGWWFKKCIACNLNGLWSKGKYNGTFADGIVWKGWLGYRYSLRSASMAIRPKRN